jgi:hypothetical protein
MDQASLVALAATVALLVVVAATVAGIVAARASRRRLHEELAASREALASVERRLDALTVPVPQRAATQFVITDLPGPVADPAPPTAPLAGQVDTGRFVSVVLSETLLKAVALGHGLRRALTADQRERVRTEMHREMRRSRRQRRLEVKQARRLVRSGPRTGVGAEGTGEDAA